jgi:hypothetical protein
LPDGASRGVHACLARLNSSCLETAAVVQTWEAAHGRPRDLLVGVRPRVLGFNAHAWLDGDSHPGQFVELLRLSADRELSPAEPR